MSIPTNSPMTAEQVLEREFLTVRAKILEVAASLDRLNRASGSVSDDPRMAQIEQGLEALLSKQSDRAERVQLIFSLDYDENWQQDFGM